MHGMRRLFLDTKLFELSARKMKCHIKSLFRTWAHMSCTHYGLDYFRFGAPDVVSLIRDSNHKMFGLKFKITYLDGKLTKWLERVRLVDADIF